MMESLPELPNVMDHLELVLRILLQIVLLSMSAFFSGSEAALFSMSRIDLERMRTTRHPMSERIHMLLDEPRRLIISILCGNELVNIASSANMAALLLMYFSEADTQWINIVIMVPLLLLVGEVTPKTFAVTFPHLFVCNFSARFLPGWIQFITPLREAVRLVADRITTFVVGEAVKKDNLLHLDEFRTLVEESEASGIIDATERILIDNMLRASHTQVYHVMTPRTSMISLDADQPLSELFDAFRRIRHPRVPVYRRTPDNIVGFLYSEDLLRLRRRNVNLNKLSLRNLLRPAHFVPPTKKVDEMFEYFQRNNTRVAVVLSEYGGVHGIITMKDVLSFIFGEISGVNDGRINYREEEGAYIVAGDMRLEKFNDITSYGIVDPVMYTIGGVVFRLFDRLPHEGESLVENNLRYTVLEMEGLRVKTLCVMPAELDEESFQPPVGDPGSGAVAVKDAFEREVIGQEPESLPPTPDVPGDACPIDAQEHGDFVGTDGTSDEFLGHVLSGEGVVEGGGDEPDPVREAETGNSPQRDQNSTPAAEG
ncbi:MAG: HlyC/CorC family transporter [Magnetococcales bacterium]|nr:HlyC/CorC family transporter [Magnetococcales bacterium]